MDQLISVVIPTYNRKELVLEAIRSVLVQEPKNYEVIVVDDGSSDRTVEYLKSLRLPIQIIAKENGGISSARNAGIKIASGQYIAFLDSDDLWLPGIVKAQLDFLQSHQEIPLVYTDQYIEVKGKRVEKTRLESSNCNLQDKGRFNLPGFIQFTPIHSSTVMVRKSIFDEIGLFNEDLKIHEDTEMWNRISEKYDLGYIDQPLGVFRWEKDPEHVLKSESRRLFVDEGRKYMKIYEERASKRGMTEVERTAIKESYQKIDKLDKLVKLWEKKIVSEVELNKKREEIFT